MDKLDEVRKLKSLLDDGIIDEEDFKRKKAELLGLNKKDNNIQSVNDKKSKKKSLDEYEKELLKQSEEQKEEDELKKKKIAEKEELKRINLEEQEKIRQKEIEEEEIIKIKRKEEHKEKITQNFNKTKEVVNKGVNKTFTVIKWIISVYIFLIGTLIFILFLTDCIGFSLAGLLMVVQSLMLCPKTSNILNTKISFYSKYKFLILVVTVVLWMIAIVNGSKTYDNLDTNSVSVNEVSYSKNL